MNNSKIILVVNYNQPYFESETYNSLKVLEENFLDYNIKKIIFWDNLPFTNNSSIEKTLKNCVYIKSNENKGLAYIYNKIIERYCKKYDFLILLDNDSKMEKEYFISLDKSIEKYKDNKLYIPIVRVNEKIYSPNKNILLFNFYFKEINSEKISSQNIFAINSGMCISCEFLIKDLKKYDERLKFYGTDNYFMNFYQKKNRELVVLNYIMEHKLSAFNKSEAIEKKIWRFKDLKHSIKIRSEEKNIFIKIVYYSYIYISSFKKVLQYKDIRFLEK